MSSGKSFYQPHWATPKQKQKWAKEVNASALNFTTVLVCYLQRVGVPLPNRLCVQDDKYGNFPNFILEQIKTFLLNCFIFTTGFPTGFVVGGFV